MNDRASVVKQPFIEGPSKEPRAHGTAGDGKGLSADTTLPPPQPRKEDAMNSSKIGSNLAFEAQK